MNLFYKQKCKVQSSKCKVERKLFTFHFKLSTDSGYTLLFAMIVASIVLALGVSLLTISRKEFVLSSSATFSSNAFYAADSGLGCAEYWGNPNGSNDFAATDTNPGAVSCAYVKQNGNWILKSASPSSWNDTNDKVTSFPVTPVGSVYETYFNMPFSTDGTSNLSCANVVIDKYYAPNNDLGIQNYLYTTITSSGYNIGYNPNATPPDCSSQSPKKVNRTLQLTY